MTFFVTSTGPGKGERRPRRPRRRRSALPRRWRRAPALSGKDLARLSRRATPNQAQQAARSSARDRIGPGLRVNFKEKRRRARTSTTCTPDNNKLHHGELRSPMRGAHRLRGPKAVDAQTGTTSSPARRMGRQRVAGQHEPDLQQLDQQRSSAAPWSATSTAAAAPTPCSRSPGTASHMSRGLQPARPGRDRRQRHVLLLRRAITAPQKRTAP